MQPKIVSSTKIKYIFLINHQQEPFSFQTNRTLARLDITGGFRWFEDCSAAVDRREFPKAKIPGLTDLIFKVLTAKGKQTIPSNKKTQLIIPKCPRETARRKGGKTSITESGWINRCIASCTSISSHFRATKRNPMVKIQIPL